MPDEKMKYPLLEFEYDKKLYEELLTLNPHPEFMDEIEPSSEDYMHDSFGLVAGDEKNALAHAVYVLNEIEKSSCTCTGQESLLSELVDDFSHYCFCVKYGSGSKTTLLAFMETMLFYGCDKCVYEEVLEWNRDANDGTYPSEDRIFNFDSLYIRMGDRFLFLENNFSAAQKFYGLASLTWSIDNTYLHAPVENFFVDFNHQYKIYTDLAQGSFYTPQQTTDSFPFYRLYNEILRLIPSAKGSSKLLQPVTEFLHKARSLLNNPAAKRLFPKRLILLMVIILTQKLLVTELARLADNPNYFSWKDIVLKKSIIFKNTPFHSLALAAQSLSVSSKAISYDDFLQLVKAAHLSDLLLTELDAESDDDPIAYYTSSEVFSYLLPEKCTGEKKGRLGKLTVMHFSYMNDPNEGQTLRKALAGTQYGSEKEGRKELNVPYVFVKCFSPRVDYLPMWEMYGDHARGCCLVIDWAGSKLLQDSIEPVLYRVCYLHKRDDGYHVLPADNQKLSPAACSLIDSQIVELNRIVNSLSKKASDYFNDLFGKARYLFKDSSYSYEQELRVIYQTKDNILHTDGDKPWLFVQTPFPLQLDEVILGPKFPDVSTRVPYLQEQLDLMCEKTGTEKPRITLSEIDYR